MRLVEYNKKYEDIHADLSTYEKDLKLTSLISDLEKTYRIPVLRSDTWEVEIKVVIAKYRKYL